MPERPRDLIWIEGTAAGCRQQALNLLADQDPDAVGWVGTTAGGDGETGAGGIRAVPAGQGRSLLGRTLAAGVIDAHSGLDPDDLGALAGAIGGGGHCLLLTPPAAAWPTAPDPALARLLSEGVSPDPSGSAFIGRLIRHLGESPAVRRHAASDDMDALPRPTGYPGAGAGTLEPTAAQKRVIDAITDLTRDDDPATLLITADRGRGKSAALGLAARALGERADIRLTAPSRSAAATALASAGRTPPVFLAPEDVRPARSLLFIDEAAAMPLPLVERLIKENRRCVITGTVHGYEGSGRGLIVRLADTLARQPRTFRHVKLSRPIRWAPDDPLERLVDTLLLLDTDPRSHGNAGAPQIECVAGADLAGREQDLADAFGLLVAGHYQTRPRDLRQLLDDPSMCLWLARDQGAVIGILAGRVEGGLDPILSREIHAGRRRPAGHLIAQSLTFHAGISEAATRRGLRIQRIAVHPDCRRAGIGRALVDAARASALDNGLDWLGTSFGMTAEVLDFWHACGLRPARVGNRRDARSGTHAVILLQALNERGDELLAQARQRLAVHLPDQLAHGLRDVTPALAARLQKDLPARCDPTAIDRVDLEAFAFGHRSLLDAHGALARWAARDGEAFSGTDRALLDAAVDQPLDSTAMVRIAGLSGRREAIARLRRLLAQSLRTDDE
ncbi:GNAT family N-acetyltransferase [Spiribacter onubensis]|uniref:tRNA(Met) cytidine acetyltransferase TmcA n=1 Tax=Spiribacter onubensis TaxID=3122420 RepID=A0ABV3S6E1_9GAMM